MEHRFDQLARSVAGATTRREALWRVGKGFALAALAGLGIGAGDPGACAQCCQAACRTLDPPPRGPAMGLCITTCLQTGFTVNEAGDQIEACPECVGVVPIP